jgi:hypothetical protein
MEKLLVKSLLLCFVSVGLFRCSSNEQVQAEPLTYSDAKFFGTSPESCEIIEFDEIKGVESVNGAVATVYSENTPVQVSAQLLTANGQFEPTNSAVLFNTTKPNGGKFKNFKTPSSAAIRPMGNVLTAGKLNGNGVAIYDKGSRIEMDFSAMGSITIKGIHVLDITQDESESTLELINSSGKVIKTMKLPVTGEFGATRLNTENTPGVVKLRVTFTSKDKKGGSGAIDVIEFCRS